MAHATNTQEMLLQNLKAAGFTRYADAIMGLFYRGAEKYFCRAPIKPDRRRTWKICRASGAALSGAKRDRCHSKISA